MDCARSGHPTTLAVTSEPGTLRQPCNDGSGGKEDGPQSGVNWMKRTFIVWLPWANCRLVTNGRFGRLPLVVCSRSNEQI